MGKRFTLANMVSEQDFESDIYQYLNAFKQLVFHLDY